jgi:hypothetical protein
MAIPLAAAQAEVAVVRQLPLQPTAVLAVLVASTAEAAEAAE